MELFQSHLQRTLVHQSSWICLHPRVATIRHGQSWQPKQTMLTCLTSTENLGNLKGPLVAIADSLPWKRWFHRRHWKSTLTKRSMGIGKKDHLADDLRGLESTPLYFKIWVMLTLKPWRLCQGVHVDAQKVRGDRGCPRSPVQNWPKPQNWLASNPGLGSGNFGKLNRCS